MGIIWNSNREREKKADVQMRVFRATDGLCQENVPGTFNSPNLWAEQALSNPNKADSSGIRMRFIPVWVISLFLVLSIGNPGLTQVSTDPNWPWEMRAVSWRWADDFTWVASHDDFVKAADSIAAHGYNTVVLWGRHFRLSNINEWPMIVSTIADLTSVFHAQGLRVFEHHSAAWIHEDYINTSLPGGGTLADLLQKDISTGKPTVGLDGHFYLACYNKTTTQQLYGRHIEDLFTRTQLDGLMSDDVAFTPHSCVCRACRDKCLAEYGFDIDNYGYPGQPPRFWDEPNHPDYRKYIRFHQSSVADHYERVRRIMNTLRPEARLMACNCSFINPYWTQTSGISLDDMADSLNVIFYEDYGNSLLSHLVQWSADAAELMRGLGLATGKPVLPLCYPGNDPEREFVWALGKTFGCRVWTDSDSEHMADLIRWEAAHHRLFYQPQIPADIAVVYSCQSRDAHRHYNKFPHGLEPDFTGWCEVLLWANLPYHVLTDKQLSADILSAYRVLILPSVTSLSDEQCAQIVRWTAAGGSLIATADCAMYDATGAPRGKSALSELLGMDILQELLCSGPVLVPDEDVFAGCGGHIDEPVRQRFRVAAHPETTVMGRIEPGSDAPALVRHTYGSGNSAYLAFRLGAASFRQARQDNKQCPDAEQFAWYGPQTPSAANVIRNLMIPVRSAVPPLVAADTPAGLIVTLHRIADGRQVVHLLNATGAALPTDGQWQCIPKHYTAFPPVNRDVEVTLPRPFTTPVVAHVPRWADRVLQVNIENNSFIVPANTIAPYVVIETGPPPAPGDFNHDGKVDILDWEISAHCWLNNLLDGISPIPGHGRTKGVRLPHRGYIFWLLLSVSMSI